MTFTKLYKKDATTGNYTYGHTKNIFFKCEFLCIHNLILAQALNLMHKIKLGIVPKPISTLFNFSNSTEKCPVTSLNNNQRNRLATLGMNNSNTIMHVGHNLNIVDEPKVQLKIQNHCFPILGPKLYNHFVAKANASEPNLIGNSSKPIKLIINLSIGLVNHKEIFHKYLTIYIKLFHYMCLCSNTVFLNIVQHKYPRQYVPNSYELII